jgi:hypothetical protein
MHLCNRVWLYLQLLFLVGTALAYAGQAPKEVSPTDQLKERVAAYYGIVQKGGKVAALNFVAPESKDDFFHMNYDGLIEFRITDVHLSDEAGTATVKIRRTDKFTNFPQLLVWDTTETWRHIDDQWFLVLPSFKEFETPFGKMRPGQQGKDSQALPMEPLVQSPQQSINSEQYLRALAKAAAEEKAKQTEEKKSLDEKPEEQTAPKQKP